MFHTIPSIRAKFSILEGRYLSTNTAISQLGYGVPILELASGLSTRGLHIGGESSVYLETDLEEILNQKKQITENIRSKEGRKNPPNHIFRPLNALDYDSLQSMGKLIQKVDPTSPIAIIHEGLFMYFDSTEQEHLRDNIYKFLSEFSPTGAWITPDFSYRDTNNPSKIIEAIKRRVTKKTGREMNLFSTDLECQDFLDRGGLKISYLPNDNVVKYLSCIKKGKISINHVLKEAQNYKVAYITLK